MDEYEALGLSPQPEEASWENTGPEEGNGLGRSLADQMLQGGNREEEAQGPGNPLLEKKPQMEQNDLEVQRQINAIIHEAKKKKNYHQVHSQMKRDLELIKAHYPQEQADALRKLPNLDTYLKYRIRGVPPMEAYQLANYEQLPVHKPAKRSGEDKQHLFPTGGGPGRHAAEPPRDVMELYRRLNPKASREEIVKHWNSCKKGERA